METRNILTEKPSKSHIFVFGSVLYKSDPSDIDILIVYDKTECRPQTAFHDHEKIIRGIEGLFGLPADVTLLTNEEEQAATFAKKVSGIEFESDSFRANPRLQRIVAKGGHFR